MVGRIRDAIVAVLTGALVLTPGTAIAQETQTAPETLTAIPLSTWQTNGTVWSIEVVDGVAYVGGSFTAVRPPGAAPGVDEVSRRFLAAFDATSGDLLPWNPLVEGPVSATSDTNCPVVDTGLRECGTVWDIEPSPDGSSIFVGGDFTRVDGRSRQGLAGFSTSTGALDTKVKPGINGRVYAIAVSESSVYAGGSFTSLTGGVPRSRVASFSRSTGETLAFAPTLDGNVRKLAMSPDESTLILGGWFNTVNGTGPRRLNAVDAVTGANAPWADQRFSTSAWVTDMRTVDGLVYVAGEANGTVNEGVDVYDPATGRRVWTDGCRGASHSLAVLRGVVYTGSHAHDCGTMIDGFVEQFNSQDPETQRRYKLRAEVPSGTTAVLLPWTPQTDDGNGPRAMATAGEEILWVGGQFKVVNDTMSQQGLTRFGFAEGGAPQAPPRENPPPLVFSSRPGQVTVTFPTGEDRDSRAVTYQVIRDGDATSPVHEVTLDSRPWAPGWYSWTDRGLEPGSQHTYEIRGVDPDGNRGPRSAPASVNVASAMPGASDVAGIEGARVRYRLDDSSAPAVDGVTGTRTAAAGSGVAFGAPGVPGFAGSAAAFSGAVGGSLADPTREWAKKQLSIELWFQTTTARGGKLIGMGASSAPGSTSGSSDRNLYLTNDGRLGWGLTPGSRRAVFSGPGYNDGAWHHVVATLDAVRGTELYVDGDLVASDPSTTWSNAYRGYWRIGGDTLSGWPSRPSSDYLAGVVDEVALYPYPLSVAQVQRHYRLGDPGLADTTGPAAPSEVVAVADGEDVVLSWTPPGDDDVLAYQVHRGSSDGFATSEETLIATTSSPTFRDEALAWGTYYYRVLAVDDSGNEGQPSDTVNVDLIEPEPVPLALSPAQDTWVNSTSPDATAGRSWVLRSRGGSSPQVTYLQFALPPLTPGRTLESASLTVATTSNSWSGSAGVTDVRLVGSAAWDELALTWATRPDPGTLALGSLPAGSEPGTIVTAPLDASLLSEYAGQVITVALTGVTSDNLEIASRESPTGSPELTILER